MRNPRGRHSKLVCLLAGSVSACMGSVGGGAGSLSEEGAGSAAAPEDNPADGLASFKLAGASGLRRLTIEEYDNTIRDLIGDTQSKSDLLLPIDQRTPFDNDFTKQFPSDALVRGADLLARDLAGALIADSRLIAGQTRLQRVLGCAPKDPGDLACLRTFVTSFGHRALRRPLTEGEVQRYLGLSTLA